VHLEPRHLRIALEVVVLHRDHPMAVVLVELVPPWVVLELVDLTFLELVAEIHWVADLDSFHPLPNSNSAFQDQEEEVHSFQNQVEEAQSPALAPWAPEVR